MNTISGSVIIDNFLNDYMLTLGEFQEKTDVFIEHENVMLCFLFFFLATFLI